MNWTESYLARYASKIHYNTLLPPPSGWIWSNQVMFPTKPIMLYPTRRASKMLPAGKTHFKKVSQFENNPNNRNVSNIHMFRLRIFSRIQILYFSRSIRVIRGQTWVKSVKKGSNRAGWSKYIKYTYVSTQNFLKNSDLMFFKVN